MSGAVTAQLQGGNKDLFSFKIAFLTAEAKSAQADVNHFAGCHCGGGHARATRNNRFGGDRLTEAAASLCTGKTMFQINFPEISRTAGYLTVKQEHFIHCDVRLHMQFDRCMVYNSLRCFIAITDRDG